MDAPRRGRINFSRLFNSSIQKVKEGAQQFQKERYKNSGAGVRNDTSEDSDLKQKWPIGEKRTSGEGTEVRSKHNSRDDSKFGKRNSGDFRSKQNWANDSCIKSRRNSGDKLKASGHHHPQGKGEHGAELGSKATPCLEHAAPPSELKENKSSDTSTVASNLNELTKPTDSVKSPGSIEFDNVNRLSKDSASLDSDLTKGEVKTQKCQAGADKDNIVNKEQQRRISGKPKRHNRKKSKSELSFERKKVATVATCKQLPLGSGPLDRNRNRTSRGRGYSQRYNKQADVTGRLGQRPSFTSSANVDKCSGATKDSETTNFVADVSVLKSPNNRAVGESEASRYHNPTGTDSLSKKDSVNSIEKDPACLRKESSNSEQTACKKEFVSNSGGSIEGNPPKTNKNTEKTVSIVGFSDANRCKQSVGDTSRKSKSIAHSNNNRPLTNNDNFCNCRTKELHVDGGSLKNKSASDSGKSFNQTDPNHSETSTQICVQGKQKIGHLYGQDKKLRRSTCKVGSEAKTVEQHIGVPSVKSRDKKESIISKRETCSKTVCKKSEPVGTFHPPSLESWDIDTNDTIRDISRCQLKSGLVQYNLEGSDEVHKTDITGEVQSECKKTVGKQIESRCGNLSIEIVDNLEAVCTGLERGTGISNIENTASEIKFEELSDIVGEKIRELCDQGSGDIKRNPQRVGKYFFHAGNKSKFYDKGVQKEKVAESFEKLNLGSKSATVKPAEVGLAEVQEGISKDGKSESHAKKAGLVSVGLSETARAPSIEKDSDTVGTGKQDPSGSTKNKFRIKSLRTVKEINRRPKSTRRSNNIEIAQEEKKVSRDTYDKEVIPKEQKRENAKSSKGKKRKSSGSNISGDIGHTRRQSGNNCESKSGGKDEQEQNNSKNLEGSKSCNRIRSKCGNSWESEKSGRNTCISKLTLVSRQAEFEENTDQVRNTVLEQNRARKKSGNSWESESSGKNNFSRPNFVNRGPAEFGQSRVEQNKVRNKSSGESDNSDNFQRKETLVAQFANKKGPVDRESGRKSSDKGIPGSHSQPQTRVAFSECFERDLPPRFRKLKERQEFEREQAQQQDFSSRKSDVRRGRPGSPESNCEIKQLAYRFTDKLNLNLHDGALKSTKEDKSKTRYYSF
jgi:hypothetical protein